MFVGRTGRTISGGSNIPDLFNSIYNILLELPPKTIIYPGHHYGFSKTISIDDNIKLSKIFQCKSLKEFELVMKNYENNRGKWHLFLFRGENWIKYLLFRREIDRIWIVNGIY